MVRIWVKVRAEDLPEAKLYLEITRATREALGVEPRILLALRETNSRKQNGAFWSATFL